MEELDSLGLENKWRIRSQQLRFLVSDGASGTLREVGTLVTRTSLTGYRSSQGASSREAVQSPSALCLTPPQVNCVLPAGGSLLPLFEVSADEWPDVPSVTTSQRYRSAVSDERLPKDGCPKSQQSP